VRRFARVLTVLALVLVALVLAAWFGGRAYLGRSVADYDGEFAVPGLSAPVEITFDSMAVPQVWAETDADLYAAFGWLHASERLFQMELVRRLVRGELSEVFGEAAYPTDVAQRRLGFARRAAADLPRIDAPTRALLERYCDGVNAWIAQRDEAGRLPPEFAVLRFTPRPWTVEDVVAVGYYQTWYAHDLSDQDGVYARLATAAGPEAARLLRAGFPWSIPSAPDRFVRETFGATPAPLRAASASNSWAVVPARSTSGAALHASDPHLTIDQAPGFWYAVGLHSAEGTEAVGVTVPGLPSIAMGHNGRIAWSFTVAAVDVLDYFQETYAEGDSSRVRSGDGWAPVRTIEEEIPVKGEDTPRRLVVRETAHGPIVRYTARGPVSVHWAGFDLPATGILNALQVVQATDFDHFRRAVTSLGALDVNWVFSSRDGHVGYQLGTPVPIRTDTLPGYALRNGAGGPSWRGFRPLGETPAAYDPASGWVATSNNRPVAPGGAYELPGYYDPYRIARITALLSQPGPFGRADMERFQLDHTSVLAARWKSLAADGADRLGDEALARDLRAWDGRAVTGSTLATVFELWWRALTPELFADDVGDSWQRALDLQEAVLTDTVAALIDDTRTPDMEDAAAISARAMETARTQAAGRTWGEAHTLTVRHPLAQVAALNSWLNLTRGPYPVDGDAATLDASFSRFDRDGARFASVTGPSMRYVMDWADVDAFTLNLALGQSGHPESPHFADFLEMNRAGRRWTVPFTRAAVEARRMSTLRLVPA